MCRFHAWQSSLLFTALFVLHLVFSWSRFLRWVFFLGDLVLIAWLVLQAYRDADTLDRLVPLSHFRHSPTQPCSLCFRCEVPIVGRIASRILDDE